MVQVYVFREVIQSYSTSPGYKIWARGMIFHCTASTTFRDVMINKIAVSLHVNRISAHDLDNA